MQIQRINNTNTFYGLKCSKSTKNINPIITQTIKPQTSQKTGLKIKDVEKFINPQNPKAIIGYAFLAALAFITSNGLFALLGFGTSIAGMLLQLIDNTPNLNEDLFNGKSNLTGLQKICKNIFLEDFDKTQAKETKKKYKNILKINSQNEFINEAFRNLVNDYQLNEIPIELDKTYIPKTTTDDMKSVALMETDLENGKFIIHIPECKNRQEYLLYMVHEMHHIKQHLLSYSALKSRDEEYQSTLTRFIEEYITKTDEGVPLNRIKFAVKKYMLNKEKMFNSFGIYRNTMSQQDSRYPYSRKLVNDSQGYKLKSKQSYYNSYEEQDAYRAENLFLDLIK